MQAKYDWYYSFPVTCVDSTLVCCSVLKPFTAYFATRIKMEEVKIFSCVINRYQDYKRNSNSQRIDMGNKFNPSVYIYIYIYISTVKVYSYVGYYYVTLIGD
jgi:hypothetical protein